MSEIELLSVIERYLNGEMNADERARFEMLRHDNPTVNSRIIEHQEFTDRLKQYGERVEFEGLLNAIHNEIDIQALKDEFVHHPSMIVRIWRNHHSKISLAASIAIFAVLSTLFFTGYLKTQANQSEVIALSSKLARVENSANKLKQQTDKLIKIVGGAGKIDPSKYTPSGTGFAISSDGYIVTAMHVTNDADSLTVQNANGDAYHVKQVYADPNTDIAVLKIVDPSFKTLGALPYGFKKRADVGENVFTIGYPLDDMVYDRGYLSSAAGSNGDTVRYRVAIKASNGNSGSPLLDENGNIIGIINSKQGQAADAPAYAIKSKYLYKALVAMAAESSTKKISLSSKNALANLSPDQQVTRMQKYIFNVKVSNK
jgi:serine protease Do